VSGEGRERPSHLTRRARSMHPNTLSAIARQRQRELLAEADAQRPGRLLRASRKQELDYPEPIVRGTRFRFPRPNLGWSRMLRRLAHQAER
jgi:hypothetical protein